MRNITILLILTIASALPARAQNAGPPPVDAQTALMILRYTLVALDQANKSNNYSVLRDLGTAEFRTGHSAARLSEIFAAHRRAGLNLASTAVQEPLWAIPPARDATGQLRLNGTFVTPTGQTRFDLVMQGFGAGWQLAGISVSAQPKVVAAAACAPANP